MKASSWSPIQCGDVVDVVAPGSRCSNDELEKSVEALKRWGLQVRVPRNLFRGRGLCSNSDPVRMQHLKEALLSPESRLVWAIRGGYGSIRLLPSLSRWKRPSQTKIFLGYSDVTSIHLFLNQRWGWPTLHGPLLERLGKESGLDPSVKRVLFGNLDQVTYRLKPLNMAARRPRAVKGEIYGGNLTVVQSTLGTPWQIHGEGQILFFEDIGERGYRVDRMLVQMEQAGIFRRARAILFGQFSGGEEKDGKKLWPKVLREFAKTSSVPVLSGVPSGHGRVQKPLPLRTFTELHLGEDPYVVVDTGVK